MHIAIASDHAGFELKAVLGEWLVAHGHRVDDLGTHSTEPVDYPAAVRPAALAVVHRKADRGIVLGGSGQGEAIAANRIKGVRCALCWDEMSARLARQHNDSNVLALGARLIPPARALSILETWLTTPFEGGRHIPRIKALDEDVA